MTVRIDYDDYPAQGDQLDDLAISGDEIEFVQIERMSDGVCWGRIEIKNGRSVVLCWSAEKRNQLSIAARED